MWPLPTTNKHGVTIHISPHELVFCWLAHTEPKKSPSRHGLGNGGSFLLKAYQRIPLQAEFFNGLIYNPTRIQQHITNFLARNKLNNNTYIVCSVSSPHLVEKFIHSPIADPAQHEIADYSHKNYNWHSLYLYPTENNQHCLHVCGVPRELLAQLQLIAITSNLNLVTITSQKMALFTLYRHLGSAAHSYGRIADDLERCHNALEHSFSLETVRRTITMCPTLSVNIEQEAPYLLTAAGLMSGEQL